MSHPSLRSLVTLASLLALSVVAAGCGKKTADSKAPASLSSADSVVHYIPADTPYAIVNAEPIDDRIVRKMTGETSAIVSSYEVILDEAFNQGIEELPEGDPDREEAERVAKVTNRVLHLFTLDGMRGAGFDINESVALYGQGLLPVVRARLVDADKFRQAIEDIERDAGESFDRGELAGNPYYYVESEDGRVLLGAFGDYVVLAYAPPNFGDDEIAELVGMTPPANSLVDTGVLADIAGEYGYTSHYVGFIDMRRLAASFVDEPSGLNATLFELADDEFDRDEISAVCREEIMQVADIAPRMVFGYSRIEMDGVAGSLVVELREDLALGLTTLTTSVPGLGTDLGGLVNFGFGIDPNALREFYSARLDAMEADPFECEYFDELQDSVAQGRAALAQPVPPVAYGFRGVVGVVDDVDANAMMRSTPPEEIDATFMIAIENAPQLMMMGTMMSPELAALDIQPDGEPVALDVPQAGMLPDIPYAAMTDDLLAVSMGANAESRITDLMTASKQDPSPLLFIAGDAGKYYDMVGESMMQGDGDELSPAAREAVRDSLVSLGEVYDRMQFDVRLTERGVEVETELSFKD